MVDKADRQSDIDDSLRVGAGVTDGLYQPADVVWQPEEQIGPDHHRSCPGSLEIFFEMSSPFTVVVRWHTLHDGDFRAVFERDLQYSAVCDNHDETDAHLGNYIAYE